MNSVEEIKKTAVKTLSTGVHQKDIDGVQTELFSMEIQTCVITGEGWEVRTVDVSSVLSFICKCPECRKGFASKYSLRLHMKTHVQRDVNLPNSTARAQRNVLKRGKHQVEPNPSKRAYHVYGADDVVLKPGENDGDDSCDAGADDSKDRADKSGTGADTNDTKIDLIRTACSDFQTESKAGDGNISVEPVVVDDGTLRADTGDDRGDGEESDSDDDDDDRSKGCSTSDDDYTPDDDDADSSDHSDHSSPEGRPHSFVSGKATSEQPPKPETAGAAMPAGGWSSASRQDTKLHRASVDNARGKKELTPHKLVLLNLVSQTEGSTKREKRSYTCTLKKDGSLKCELCGKTLRGRQKYIEHLNMHTGRKPYKCAICGQAYPRISQLNVHSRIHRGEDLHTCPDCGKQFTMPSALRQHSTIHTGIKPHQCTICGKQFRLKNILVRHMGSHTGEKPHQCTICGKAFTKLFSLKDHLVLHDDDQDQPFVCCHCGKTFKYRSKRNHHVRTAHEPCTRAQEPARKEHEQSSKLTGI